MYESYYWCIWSTGKKFGKIDGEEVRNAFREGWNNKGKEGYYQNHELKEAYIAGKRFRKVSFLEKG